MFARASVFPTSQKCRPAKSLRRRVSTHFTLSLQPLDCKGCTRKAAGEATEWSVPSLLSQRFLFVRA